MPAFDFYWTTLTEVGCASFALYVFMIATIVRYRKSPELQSSFFKLWISMGVADCCQFVHSYFLMRLPLLGAFRDFYGDHASGIFPKLGLSGTYYYLFVQLFGNFLYALNRYTAMAKLTEHERIWSENYRLQKVIVLQWLLPILLVLQFVRETITLEPLPDNSLLLHVCTQDEFINTMIASATIFVAMVVCAVLYYKSIRLFIKHRKNATSQDASARRKQNIELRLSIAAVIVFIAMLAYGVFELTLGFYSFMGNSAMVAQVIPNFYIINDFFAMINPWSLLFTCTAVRKYMLKMVGINCVPQPTSIGVSMAPGSAMRSARNSVLGNSALTHH